MAALFWAQTAPDVPAPPGGFTDKQLHAAFYGILGALALRTFARTTWSRVTILTSISAIAWAATYGIALEFCQRFAPHRSYEVLDMIADAIGAATAVGIIFVWSIIKRRT